MSPRRKVAFALAALAGLALSSWEGTLRQSDAVSHWSVLSLIGVTLAAAAAAGRGRQRSPSAAWARHGITTLGGELGGSRRRPGRVVAASAVWAVLIMATIGWDLNSFVHQAHDLPTLSRLFGDVTEHAWGRALLFAGWLALGAYLAVGWRRPESRAREVQRPAGSDVSVPSAPGRPGSGHGPL